MHAWEWSTILIIIDAHSKWLEAIRVHSANSNITIIELMRIFDTHGLPKCIVSDNVSCFTTEEFKGFVNSNDIKHFICSLSSSLKWSSRTTCSTYENIHTNIEHSIEEQFIDIRDNVLQQPPIFSTSHT